MPEQIIQIEADNIYDVYPLYYELYSRSKRYKKSETNGAFEAMKALAVWNNRTGNIDFQKVGFNVLEVLAGRGDHQPLYPPLDPFKINSYYNLDIRHHEGENFIQGDATTYKVLPERGINFIIGFFFTGSTITDENGVHSRKVLIDLFKNAKANLPKGGGFMIDFSPGGYNTSITCAEPADIHYQAEVPKGNELRALCKVDEDSPCIISYMRRIEYDRNTSTVYDYFPYPFEIWANGEKYAEIKIKQPLTQRYISETELVDIAHEAGFEEIQLFNFSHPKGPYQSLPMRYSITSKIVDADALMATNILCINK